MKALLNDPTYNDLKKLISKKNRETTINVITILYSYLVIQTYCCFCFFYCHCLVNILLSPSHTCCREFLIIIIIIIVQICLCLRRLLCFAFHSLCQFFRLFHVTLLFRFVFVSRVIFHFFSLERYFYLPLLISLFLSKIFEFI